MKYEIVCHMILAYKPLIKKIKRLGTSVCFKSKRYKFTIIYAHAMLKENQKLKKFCLQEIIWAKSDSSLRKPLYDVNEFDISQIKKKKKN